MWIDVSSVVVELSPYGSAHIDRVIGPRGSDVNVFFAVLKAHSADTVTTTSLNVQMINTA